MYVLEMNRIYNVDCVELMKQFPDKFFELAIVDPPYGINATKMSMGTNLKRTGDGYTGLSTAQRLRKGRLNQGAGKLKNRALNTLSCDWDFKKPGLEYFEELFRVSKNQVIFGGNYFDLPPTRCVIVWDKLQPWENFSQVEIAWTSFDKPAAIFKYSNTCGANREEKIHPTQKPVRLYEWILSKFAKQGDKILDTHVGSASSLIACYNNDFDFIGAEINEEYYRKASERLQFCMSQLKIPDF